MKDAGRGRPLSDRARRGALDRWRASGLTQAEFCRREGLHPATFSGWKRQFALYLPTSAPAGGRPTPTIEPMPTTRSRATGPVRFVEAKVVPSSGGARPAWVGRGDAAAMSNDGAAPLPGAARFPPKGSGVTVVVGAH